MSEMDQRTSNAIAQLRHEWGPPSGVEDRMLADFHARLEPPEGGGDGGLASTTGQALYVVKIVAAVAGLAAAGLGGVALVAKLVRGPEPRTPAREHVAVIEASPEPSRAEQPLDPPVEQPVELESPAEPPPPDTVRPRARPESQLDVAAELALIRQARVAKPEQALELLEQHEREFPSGALANEREALRAAASCTLGRLDDARAAIDRLSAQKPGPLLLERVRAACEKNIEVPTTESAGRGDGSL
jgi:hypothetical protein